MNQSKKDQIIAAAVAAPTWTEAVKNATTFDEAIWASEAWDNSPQGIKLWEEVDRNMYEECIFIGCDEETARAEVTANRMAEENLQYRHLLARFQSK